jgi:type 1 glutamine amidotransferase
MTSQQVLGGEVFRFSGDRRHRLLMIIAEDEYETEKTLPDFAAKHLSHHFSVSMAFARASERHEVIGMDQIQNADALLVSVRRRALPEEDLQRIRDFVASGKPVIGIRTASHAFSLRGNPPPEQHAVWENFDPLVIGGNYRGHYANSLTASLSLANGAEDHPILQALAGHKLSTEGSLYQTAPLEPGALPLLVGSVDGEAAQPVAWTFIRGDGGRTFYTSLGHPGDFKQVAFESLLSAGIHWACGLPMHSLEEIEKQSARYARGSGKQR